MSSEIPPDATTEVDETSDGSVQNSAEYAGRLSSLIGDGSRERLQWALEYLAEQIHIRAFISLHRPGLGVGADETRRNDHAVRHGPDCVQ